MKQSQKTDLSKFISKLISEQQVSKGQYDQFKFKGDEWLPNSPDKNPGDNKYGYPRANKDRSICLHSYKLAFNHPVTKERMELQADLPEDAFWQKFR